ncbi:Inositolphosphorylceramide synthase subunit Kei1-domain-containing protein [Roridomyces roridus]|uniref:Inositolphosphorylceramide synthase subunit Kei1-domain-containing protein n=1 Tax=Roridomyces roridus TaxID=1738132 RepID=A0AAD7BTM6_9AGAR|nr:Inositolphosphorylceramide synthase subunit Kei1-domain-containing protein [Roridomyces roridus]
MLRNGIWPLNSFLGVLDLKTGVTIAILFAVLQLAVTVFQLLNKVAGVYGLIAVLTGAAPAFAQLSLYIYSVVALVGLVWGLQVVKVEDPRKTLYFAHLFAADYVLSTSWTVYFAVQWWVYTPHDGAKQANSRAQQDMIDIAHLTGPTLTDEERAEAALNIWNHEKGTAMAVIVLSWLSKIYLCLVIYSLAVHLRQGTFRSLARTQPSRPTGSSIQALDLPDEEDEEIEDFYRVPLRQPSTPTKTNGSVSSFADFVGDNPKRGSASKAPPPETEEDEVLFDDDYQYASSGPTSKATSKRGTESSRSRSASTDNEEDAGERTAFVARNPARR